MSRLRRRIRFGIVAVLCNVMACASDATSAQIQALIDNLQISLGLTTLAVGQTVQADALAHTASGGTLSGVTIVWSSANPAIASVTSTGLVTAVAPGTTQITGAVGSISATANVTVVPPVASVSVALTSSVQVGTPVVATATPKDGAGNSLTGRVVAWSSSNTAVATVSSVGVVTPVIPGTTNIVATVEGITGSAVLTVLSSSQAPVSSVSVALGSPNIAPGQTTNAQVTTRDAANNVLTGRTVTWSSSDISIATVSAAGVVTGVTGGTATITATSEGIAGSAAVTVQIAAAAVAVSIADNPINIDRTTTATATVRDINGNVLSGRSIAWSSSASGIATVLPTGTVVGVSTGTATIIATCEGITGSATINVQVSATSISVALGTPQIRVGSTTQATATIRDGVGNVLFGHSVSWTSSNAGVASVALDGTVTAVAVGTASIIASADGINGSGPVTVQAASGGGGGGGGGGTTPLPASQLGIVAQPGGAISGQTLTLAPVIEIRDANGSLVTSANNTVAATISSGTGSLATQGSSVTAVNGVAVFPSLQITGTGVHQLMFSSLGLLSTTSAPFNVAPVVVPLTTTQVVPAISGTVNAALAPVTPVTASGGTPPYAFSLTGGTLPSGLNFNSATGQLSGTPTTALALTTFTVTVSDAGILTSSKTFSLTVTSANGVALQTTQAIAAKVVTANAAVTPFIPVTASGGTPPYAFAITVGVLPNGLSVSSTTGQISGTPTAALAVTTYTIIVTDALASTSSKTFNLTVNPALVATRAVASVVGAVNVALPPSIPVTASAGTPPYTFTLSGGNLPTGMTFSASSGQLAGTPTTQLAQTTFTVTVRDAAGAAAPNTFTLMVNSPLTTVQAVASTTATVNSALNPFTPVTASGGTTPYTFAISAGGPLPTGVTLNPATGQISGTPTIQIAPTIFTVRVTDALSATSSNTFSLAVTGSSPGNLIGSVVTGSLAPIGGGTIEVYLGTTLVKTATVAGDGTYSISGLPSATYNVRLQPPLAYSMGPAEPFQRSVTVPGVGTATQSFTVQPAIYSDDFQAYTSTQLKDGLNKGTAIPLGDFLYSPAHNMEIASMSNAQFITIDPNDGFGKRAMRYDWPAQPTNGTDYYVDLQPGLSPPPVMTNLWVRFTSRESAAFEHGASAFGRAYKFILIGFENGTQGLQGRFGTYLVDGGGAPPLATSMATDITDNKGGLTRLDPPAAPVIAPVSWGGSYHTWVLEFLNMGTANCTHNLYMDGVLIASITGPFLSGRTIGGPGWAIYFEAGSNINSGPDHAQSRWWREFGVYTTRPSLRAMVP